MSLGLRRAFGNELVRGFVLVSGTGNFYFTSDRVVSPNWKCKFLLHVALMKYSEFYVIFRQSFFLVEYGIYIFSTSVCMLLNWISVCFISQYIT